MSGPTVLWAKYILYRRRTVSGSTTTGDPQTELRDSEDDPTVKINCSNFVFQLARIRLDSAYSEMTGRISVQ